MHVVGYAELFTSLILFELSMILVYAPTSPTLSSIKFLLSNSDDEMHHTSMLGIHVNPHRWSPDDFPQVEDISHKIEESKLTQAPGKTISTLGEMEFNSEGEFNHGWGSPFPTTTYASQNDPLQDDVYHNPFQGLAPNSSPTKKYTQNVTSSPNTYTNHSPSESIFHDSSDLFDLLNYDWDIYESHPSSLHYQTPDNTGEMLERSEQPHNKQWAQDSGEKDDRPLGVLSDLSEKILIKETGPDELPGDGSCIPESVQDTTLKRENSKKRARETKATAHSELESSKGTTPSTMDIPKISGKKRKRTKKSNGVYFRELAWFVELEGSLIIGQIDGLSSKIENSLLKTIQKTAAMEPMNKVKQVIWDLLKVKFAGVKHHFLKAFFGGISILCDQDLECSKKDMIMQGWDFIENHLERWSHVPFQRINVRSSETPAASNNAPDWEVPEDLLIYFMRLKDMARYKKATIISLLNQYSTWTTSQSSRYQFSFDEIVFDWSCKKLRQKTLKSDSLFGIVSNSRILPPDILISKKSQDSIPSEEGRPKGVKRPKKSGTKKNDTASFKIGQDLIDSRPTLMMDIERYFEKLHDQLYQMYSQIPTELDSKQNPNQASSNDDVVIELQKFKDIELENSIYSAHHRITPAFLGMVIIFHSHQGEETSLEHMIQHAWSFLKQVFSKWETPNSSLYTIRFPDQFKNKKCLKQIHVEWSDPYETFNYFKTRFENVEFHITSFVWYLARQWQALWIEKGHNLPIQFGL